MPELSVVVVSLLNEEDIPSVRHLRRQEFDDYELIVRDDPGICTARNRGIEEASSDLIVFIDDDAVPRQGYLRAAARSLSDHAAVAGRVIHPVDDVIAEFPTHYDQGTVPKSTDVLVGCNMAFRKEVFETVGMFDENIIWGHDETELADRVRERFNIFYDPEMCVEHAYADGVVDYWSKMYRFGPADVYYGQKNEETSFVDGLKTMLGPSSYLSDTLYGTAVKSIGRVIRNLSILKAMIVTR